jgi:hypothetical protein
MRRDFLVWLRSAGDALRGGLRGLAYEVLIVAAMSVVALAFAFVIRLAV